MNFMFEWQEQYLTSERSERVRYCSCHENIKFISSSQRVIFFLYNILMTNSLLPHTYILNSDQHESFGYFGHCGHINKPVYFIYFSPFVNLLIL